MAHNVISISDVYFHSILSFQFMEANMGEGRSRAPN